MVRRASSSSPLRYEAQLATLVEAPPEGDDWWHEQKLDGYRIGARVDEGDVRLWSRSGQDWTDAFPSVAAAVAALGARRALLDGEVAVLLPNGVTSFQALQTRGAGTALTYFVFDLLHLGGDDLRPLPLEERKRRLRALLDGAPKGTGKQAGVIRYSDHIAGSGAAFFAQACKLGLEGIVSKRRDAPYHGGRNMDWRKAKCLHRQELVIGGFTEPEGSRVGIGSLVLGYYDGPRLQWAGSVGTGPGWTAAFLRDLRRRLDRIEAATSPFDPPVADSWLQRHARWVRPELVAEVAFTEWTDDHRIRHPSMQGLRADKAARDVTRERPTAAPQPSPPSLPARPSPRRPRRTKR
jgi:bifunctional non-homologous end joining protein LigD